ncbi:MAG TPA: hypothetical protein ENN80_12835, partial [Candidatus Hydrogenedentes bacterium]|nr:hypothetical protein [Candidatus Hydrogenedentota bacterium]
MKAGPVMSDQGATASLYRWVDGLLFPRNPRVVFLEQLGLAIAAALFVGYFGPLGAGLLALAALAAMPLLFGPPRPMLSLFVVFMIASHQYRSFAIVSFAGIEWHPREFLLFALLAHWAVNVLRGKARFTADPAGLAVLSLGLLFVQIALVGLFREPNLQAVIAECRYPIFLLSFVVFASLVRDRKDLYFYTRLVFGLTLAIAGAALAFFAYTVASGTVVNAQNALGEYVQRPFGPGLIQSVRPNGHMFFEVSIVVLLSLVFSAALPRTHRLWYVCLAAFLCAAVAITMMRTAYVTLVVSLAVLAVLLIPSRFGQLLLLGAAVALVLAFLVFFGPLVFDQLDAYLPSTGASIQGRLVEIAGAWQTFLEHPILGAGMGASFEGMGYVSKTSELAYAQATYA